MILWLCILLDFDYGGVDGDDVLYTVWWTVLVYFCHCIMMSQLKMLENDATSAVDMPEILCCQCDCTFPCTPCVVQQRWYIGWLHVSVCLSMLCQILYTMTFRHPGALGVVFLPVAQPTQCQSIEWKISHSKDLFAPSSPGGSSNFVFDH